MKIKVLCFLILSLSACSPVATTLPTLVGSLSPSTESGMILPDLVVSGINVAQVDGNGRCLGEYKISATISNQGQALAVNVEAVEMATGQPIAIDRLEAGQSKTVYLSTSPTSGSYIVVVDPQNQISESNETNNNLSFLAPTPTLVLECMKSPTVESTPMPPLASTPQPNVTPSPNSLDGLIYADMGVAQLWQINHGQQLKIMDGIAASFSQDGSQAVYEQGYDIWLSEPALGSSENVTHSSDRIDRRPQLWQSLAGQRIVFSSVSDGDSERLYLSNLAGTEVVAISSDRSYSPPGLDPTGQRIAFDEIGKPMIFLDGNGVSPFLSQLYNYQPEDGSFFTSPSISPNGALISWWVCKKNGSTQICNLVVFTLAGEATYKIIHSYSADANMLDTWLPNPIWSPDGQWIAFQTYAEETPYDIWIMHPDGSEAYRIGLALNPVWNPDSRHLAYNQRYPQTVSSATTVNIIETGSFNTESTLIPFGSIPVAWFGSSILAVPNNIPRFPLPSFSAPIDWGKFSNTTPPFTFRYPPDALIEVQNDRLVVKVPFSAGTQMIEKSVRIERQVVPPGGCYALIPWQGTLVLNGTEYHYVEGHLWEHAMGGLTFFQNIYTANQNGFCITVSLRIGIQDTAGATGTTPIPYPSSDETNPEILFDILSTLQLQ